MYGDQIMAHPVGTGPFRLADWRRSSRIVLERNTRLPRRDLRCAMLLRVMPSSARSQPHCRASSAAGRPRRGLHHRRAAAALAGVPERRARHAGAIAGDFRQRRGTWRTAGAQPQAARHHDVARARGRHHVHRVQHEGPGDWRIHAGARGAAARNFAGYNIAGRDTASAARTRRSGPGTALLRTPSATTRRWSRKWASTICRVPRRCSTPTAMSIGMATDGASSPTAHLWLFSIRRSPTKHFARWTRFCKRNIDKLGIRFELKYGKWPEQLKSARAAKFMTWGLGSQADRVR